jgi:GNAT superfamily N-acetyltransferase
MHQAFLRNASCYPGIPYPPEVPTGLIAGVYYISSRPSQEPGATNQLPLILLPIKLTMEIFIRQMSESDASAVAILSRQLGYSLSEEQILQNIKAVLADKDHDAFVAVYEKQVVGWIGLAHSIQIELPPYCVINGLVVNEDYRGKGIGKLLIEKAKQWGREKGNNTLRLRCNVKRDEAHLFYQHHGFKETKQQILFEIKI